MGNGGPPEGQRAKKGQQGYRGCRDGYAGWALRERSRSYEKNDTKKGGGL